MIYVNKTTGKLYFLRVIHYGFDGRDQGKSKAILYYENTKKKIKRKDLTVNALIKNFVLVGRL